VLDLDALGKAEKRKLGLGRRHLPGPEHRRCLLSLSRGGADAKVVREFDTVDKRFVDGGFVTVPEAKTDVDLDRRRHALHRHRLRPRLADRFGLPARHQALARGQPLADAVTVFEGERPTSRCTPGWTTRPASSARASAATPASTIRSSAAAGGQQVPLDKPSDASLSFWRERVLISCAATGPWLAAPGRAAACWWPTRRPT
jgi:prolyl oligopeptidase